MMAMALFVWFLCWSGWVHFATLAEEYVEGHNFPRWIVLHTKDRLAPFDGKRLLLIEMRDNCYYLVKRVNLVPQQPHVYIVPGSQVLSAEINPPH
jgi:hypothetical protein